MGPRHCKKERNVERERNTGQRHGERDSTETWKERVRTRSREREKRDGTDA